MKVVSRMVGGVSRERALIAICIFLITVLAWLYLLHLDQRMAASARSESMMAAMGMPSNAPWGASDVFIAFSMWAVMMVGMMTPSAAPVLVLFAGLHARRGASADGGMPVTVLLLGLGYIAVWLGFSTVAALAQWGMHEGAWLSSGMAATSSRVAGTILVVAGLYQFTPLKGACLKQCQSPLGFLMTNWHEGRRGALRMGLRHGMYCLGCCWALMCVLFAVGVMNLAWVAALAAFILLEKFGRTGAIAARVAGAILITAGVLVVTS